jgi:hypothetical protein
MCVATGYCICALIKPNTLEVISKNNVTSKISSNTRRSYLFQPIQTCGPFWTPIYGEEILVLATSSQKQADGDEG